MTTKQNNSTTMHTMTYRRAPKRPRALSDTPDSPADDASSMASPAKRAKVDDHVVDDDHQ